MNEGFNTPIVINAAAAILSNVIIGFTLNGAGILPLALPERSYEALCSARLASRPANLAAFLVALLCALGLFFHHGELDFPLHVVDAVHYHAYFVADGIGLLAARADDLPRVFVVGVNVVGLRLSGSCYILAVP